MAMGNNPRSVSVVKDAKGKDEVERYNVYHVAMIFRHGKDNKKYLYDIMNIKKEMSSLFQSEDLTQ